MPPTAYYGTPLPSRVGQSPFQHPPNPAAAVSVPSPVSADSNSNNSTRNVLFAPNTTFNVMSNSRSNNGTPMPKKAIMTHRNVSIDVMGPSAAQKSTPVPSYLKSSSVSGKENSSSSCSRQIQAVSFTNSRNATPTKKRLHSDGAQKQQLSFATPTISAAKRTKKTHQHASSSSSVKVGPFSVKKSAKKAKLTPPRPRTASKKTLGSAKKPTTAKKTAKQGAKKQTNAAPSATATAVLPTEAKDRFVLRTSEQDPSPFQIELPTREATLIHAKISNVMDKYMEIGGVEFDFNDLVSSSENATTPSTDCADDTTSKECYEVMSSLRDIVHDIKVEGFYREYYDSERVEACILSSHSLRQFIVCYRGGTSVQSKPVRGHDKYVKLGDDEDCILHAKHPVAVMPTFRDAYFAGDLEENVFYVLNRLASLNPFCDVTMIGHSFGSAIATLGATRYASLCPQIRVACTVFGSPKVGGDDFCQLVHSLPNLRVVRVERTDDAYTCMPEGAKWRHAGHSISIVPPQAAAFSTTLIESMVGGSTIVAEEDLSHNIIAYKFNKGKPGPSNSLLHSVSELSRMLPLGHSKGAACDIGLYIEEVEKFVGDKWVKDYAGMVGDGVKSGIDNEARLVV